MLLHLNISYKETPRWPVRDLHSTDINQLIIFINNAHTKVIFEYMVYCLL